MANNEGTPLHGDRSAWNVVDHPGEHSKDIEDAALLRHLPAPDTANNFSVDDGTNWVSKTLAQVVALIESLLDHGNIQGLGDGSDHSFINQDVTTTGTPTFGVTTLADGSKLATNAAPVADVDIANKKYVDDNAAGIADIVEDLTPQLGGDLDLNGHGIDFPTTPNITDVLDEDDMVSDSATKLATQQSIKKYVDDNAGGSGEVVDDLTPQLGGDLDLNGHGIDFPTTPNITDVLDEDNMVSDSATKLATQQSIKKYVDDKAISGSEVVDDLTPQLGGDLDLNGHGIDFPTTPNITDVLDEDNMISNSATKLATQQSIKKYVDDSVVGGGGGADILEVQIFL